MRSFKKNLIYDNRRSIIQQSFTFKNCTQVFLVSKTKLLWTCMSTEQSWYKKTLKLANEIISIKNKSQQNNKLLEDSECPKDNEELTNFFSEVGKSLSSKINPSPITYRHFLQHINSKNSLFLSSIDAYEIQLHNRNLKMKSNSSTNDIPSNFFKIASCIVSEWLSNFFNKCTTIGKFPDSWKITHITPISKVHNPSSSSEYRPISVLLVLSKLFEKGLYHRVYSYMTEHNLIDKTQYGFRVNHSTDLAITTIYDELLKYFDKQLITCSLF